MLVSSLFTVLAAKELSNTGFLDDDGNLLESKRATVISYLNDGLTVMHTRFPMKTKKLWVKQVDNLNEYRLTLPFAYSQRTNYPDNTHYIWDSDEVPFLGDFVRAIFVEDSCHKEVPLNDTMSHKSVYTPQPDVIYVQAPVQDVMLGVTYQALHEEVPLDNLNYDIQIPRTLERAITSYVASNIYASINTPEAMQRSATLMQLFEDSCSTILQNDILSTSTSTEGKKFHDRGFV